MRKFDATDLEATTGVASFLYAIYRYLSPTRRRLAALEAGQIEIKNMLTDHAAGVDLKFTQIFTILASNPPTRRRS